MFFFKRLLFLLFIFVVSDVSSAQSFGLRFGVNTSNVHLSESNSLLDFKPLMGVQAGIVTNIELAPRFALETGVYWQQRGYSFEGSFAATMPPRIAVFEISKQLNYLEVPIVAKKYFGESKNGLFVQLGANFNLGLSVRDKEKELSGQDNKETSELKNWNETNLNSLDLGATIGLGAHFKNFELLGGFYQGFLDLDSDPMSASRLNQTFSISVAYFVRR
jgi:hypothetical protein